MGRISGIVERKLGSGDLDTFNDFLLSVGRSIAEAAAKAKEEAAAKARADAEKTKAKAKAASKSRFTVFVAEHKVASGESLSVISQKYYNTQANWRFIYEANQDLIGDNPSLIRPGQVLKIPKL